MSAEIFRAYDVRGIAGRDLTPEIAAKIAWAFGRFLSERSGKTAPLVFLGHDARLSSEDLYRAAANGLVEAGANLETAGLCTTPMMTFLLNNHKAGGSLMITASHNPPEYNGMKFYIPPNIQVGLESGLLEIKSFYDEAPAISVSSFPETKQYFAEYARFLSDSFSELKGRREKIGIAIDNGNGTASLVLDRVLPEFPWLSVDKLFWDADGNFPGRGPNPFLPGAREPLAKVVREKGLKFGAAFDADADRVFFVDENGAEVPSDWIIAWFADYILKKNPMQRIVSPVGISRIVQDVVVGNGGELIFSKTGPVAMRSDLLRHDAIFGGERSGHFYFRDFFFADSGIWAFFEALKIFLESGKPLSEILAPYKKYFGTGEINIEVEDRNLAMRNIKARYGPKAKNISELDGFFADFGDWWLLARPSNTEPLVRIVIESPDFSRTRAATKEVLDLLSLKT